MERRAVVVQHAGHGELAAPGAAADVIGGFEHLDVDPVLGEAYGAGEPVGPGPDDHGGGHHTAPAPAGGRSWATVATTASVASTGSSLRGRVQVTCSGIGPFGSHGSSSTESATL